MTWVLMLMLLKIYTIGVEGEWEDRANVKRDLEIIHILYGQRIHLLQRLKTHLLT